MARKITTLVTDMLGSVFGKHCLALQYPLLESFKRYEVPITKEEANKPTGINKIEHIAEILRMEEVIIRFKQQKKRKPDLDKDVKALFKLYEPLQIETLSNPEFIRPLPKILKTLDELKGMGIKIVATTGFKSTMVRAIFANSEENIGRYFDDFIPVDDVRIKRGRPYPDEVLAAMIAVGCENVSCCIKADDTNPGIMAGHNAGVKTLALARYNNFTGLHTEDIDELEKKDPKAAIKLLRDSYTHMEASKPTYTCQSLADIIPLIRLLNSSNVEGVKRISPLERNSNTLLLR
jgi:phosphonoacetaldehyde hydrolase